MIIDQQTKKLIEGLNANGYSVLSIDGELFIITTFNNAEGITTKHILVGKDITNINTSHLLPNMASVRQDKSNTAVVTYIQSLPSIKREWHEAITYTTYTPIFN